MQRRSHLLLGGVAVNLLLQSLNNLTPKQRVFSQQRTVTPNSTQYIHSAKCSLLTPASLSGSFLPEGGLWQPSLVVFWAPR